MDEDIELILPDDPEAPDIVGIYPDFSQVQIQVHGIDVAENIAENADASEIFGTEEYLEPQVDNDVVELSDDYPENPETSTEDFKQNILAEENHNIPKYSIAHEGILENDHYDENFDNIERIPDKDISKYDAVIEEYLEYNNVSIKEEVEPFMGTDYTDFGPGLVEEPNDESPQSTFNSNVIILGSKPCQSTSNGILKKLLQNAHSDDEEEIKKENLNAVVLLENWGTYLEDSQTFCADCGTLFVTPNDLDAHKMVAHSFLVPISKNVAIKSTTKSAFARKSTGTVIKNNKSVARKSTGSKAAGSTYCNHCDQVFPDNDTLIKHLYELLTVKKFTCTICNAIFNTQKELTNHSVVHVKTEKVQVKKEKIDVKIKSEVIKTKSIPIEFDAIPKSILFQCPKCYLHFVTANASYSHYVNCNGSNTIRPPRTCDVCNRNIHARDLSIHKKQHKLCAKFKIYKVNKDSFERTLCKCSNCKLHFSERGLSAHLKDCGKIASTTCGKCKIKLPKSKLYAHMRMHTKQNLKPKDLTYVEYSVQRCAVKRKMDAPKLNAKKIKLEYPLTSNTSKIVPKLKIKQETLDIPVKENSVLKVKSSMPVKNGNKYRIHFCKHCKGCCYNRRSVHLNRQCTVTNDAVICQKCGLQFLSLKYHKSHHQENLTLQNIEFYDVETLVRTVPQLPDYPQCSDCKIKFFSVKTQSEHICGEDYEMCNVCGDKYHFSAFDVHMDFHKLIDKKKPNKTATKLIPELMKKYQSLNKMWHFVYCCKRCDIITDQYDKAVEHSQDHLNGVAAMKNIRCYICSLKIDETYWSKHSELHSQMNIDSKTFKILNYNPRKLLSEEWFELFDSLPIDEIKQVTDKSVYSNERRFKMKVLKEGRSEYTVYCCGDCKVACRHNEIEKHVNSACKNSSNICETCSIQFSDISTLKNHQLLHMKGVKKEEFRVVIFTKKQIRIKVKQPKLQTKAKIKQVKPKLPRQPMSKATQQKLKALKKKNIHVTVNKLGKLTFKGIEVDSKGKYILYKCRKCQRCLHLASHAKIHTCWTKKYLKKCKHCHVLVECGRIADHENRHERNPDFNVKNIKIVVFDPVKIQKRESEEIIPAKKKRKASMSPKKTKSPSRRSLKSPNKISNADRMSTAPSPKLEASVVTTTTKIATIYKCECGLHYTSLKNIEKHAEICNSDAEISKENCSKCGLLFPTDALVTHLCKHHSKNSKFTVELYQKEANEVSTSESPAKKTYSQRTTLYKCSDCNVCFVNQNTCYKHAYRNHQRIHQKKCIDCKLCGFQFTLLGLPVHVNRHHNGDLSLDNIVVEEYYPVSGIGVMKIDRYVASDKVQSLQVTSSIEE